jgi:hypothetical protein
LSATSPNRLNYFYRHNPKKHKNPSQRSLSLFSSQIVHINSNAQLKTQFKLTFNMPISHGCISAKKLL